MTDNANTPRCEWFEDEIHRVLPRLLAVEGFDGLKGKYKRPYYDSFAHLRDPAEEQVEHIWANPGETRMMESGGRKNYTHFEDRVRRAAEPDVWKTSAEATTGLPFVNPVLVTNESAYYTQRKLLIDRVGPLHSFLAHRHHWKYVEGISFGMADMPAKESVANGAPRIPYLAWFSPTDMIDWDYAERDGQLVLTECRIRRWASRPRADPRSQNLNEWKLPARQLQIWHYVAGDPTAPRSKEEASAHFAVYARAEEDDKASWAMLHDWRPILSREASVIIRDLPIRAFYTRRFAPFQDRPVFAGSAKLMPKLLRRSSEADALARKVSGLKMVASGVTDASQVVVAGGIIGIPADGRAYMFEPTGEGLEKLEKKLIEIKKDIVTENLDPLAEGSFEMSAAEVDLREQKARSTAELFVNNDSASATLLMRDWERLAGVERPTIEVTVPKPPILTTAMMRALTELATGRRPVFTPKTILKIYAQHSNLMPEGFDAETEAAAVAELWAMGGRGYTREGETQIPFEQTPDSGDTPVDLQEGDTT